MTEKNDPASLNIEDIFNKMPAEELFLTIVDIFQALADPTRAKILYALSSQPFCVGDLARLTGVSESAVSHQMRLLRDRRLVKSSRKGNRIVYSLSQHHLAALFREAEYTADHLVHHIPDHDYPIP